MSKIVFVKKDTASNFRKTCLMAGVCLSLSGCFGGKPHKEPQKTVFGNEEIVLLLPLSGNYAPVGAQLKNAAMLGFSQDENTPPAKIKIFDTGTLSPKDAVQAAIAEKAALVLGPITTQQTQEASAVLSASNIPEISFTSDSHNEKENLWVAGLTAREQVFTLIEALKAQGKNTVAAFLPENGFGHSFGEALSALCQENNFPEPQIVYHDNSPEHIAQSLQLLAQTEQRHEALDKMSREGQTATLPPPPFQALLLADTGLNLRNIIDYLPDSGIVSSQVQIMGPALWQAFDAKLAALQGAWYAAPDVTNREDYVKLYEAKYQQKPMMLTDIAYDLAVLGKRLQQSNTLSAESFLAPEGFTGIDGKYFFRKNGRMERELALYQILPSGGAKIIPKTPPMTDLPQQPVAASAENSAEVKTAM